MQMVLQGLWFEKDSSLLMLPNMNDDLIRNSSNTKTWEPYALKRVSFSDHLTTSMVISSHQLNLEGTHITLSKFKNCACYDVQNS